MLIKARYVVPVDSPVIEGGAVKIERRHIAAVGPAHCLHSPPITDYGDAVICPGFVNAHTHLDLSALAGRILPGSDFADWLWRLVAALSAEPVTRKRLHQAVQAGVTQLLGSGVTMVGDITRRPDWTRDVLADSPLSAVSFGEVIAVGVQRHLLAERLGTAASSRSTSERIRAGISPHAPYTVEPEGMLACAERARASSTPLCVHLAESREEELFTRSHAGPLVDHLRTLGVWDDSIPAAGCGPIELALRTGVLSESTIIAHANYVTDADMDLIAATGASVAYCPRTHRAFGHPPHRFREMLAAGINVCIGTDSLASSPSLSILDELRFLRREYPECTGEELIAMGTLRGARALGFDDTAGSLTPGKAADLVVIPLRESNADAGWASILDSTEAAQAVYVAGQLQQIAKGLRALRNTY